MPRFPIDPPLLPRLCTRDAPFGYLTTATESLQEWQEAEFFPLQLPPANTPEGLADIRARVSDRLTDLSTALNDAGTTLEGTENHTWEIDSHGDWRVAREFNIAFYELIRSNITLLAVTADEISHYILPWREGARIGPNALFGRLYSHFPDANYNEDGLPVSFDEGHFEEVQQVIRPDPRSTEGVQDPRSLTAEQRATAQDFEAQLSLTELKLQAVELSLLYTVFKKLWKIVFDWLLWQVEMYDPAGISED